jgi:curved DNA-binding protein CbpA
MHAYRPNHYEALGVSRSADAEAIRTAWRAKAKQVRPDLSEGSGPESGEAFRRLQEAYDVLRDPERRAHYDDTLGREAAIEQAQIEKVEAARKRMAAQLSELEANKPPASGAPGKAPAMLAARVQCTGRGTNIVLTRAKDIARVSYDNGPEAQPRISDLGSGSVLVSRIEPTNKIAIGFTKGDRNGTTLLMFDEAGRVRQTFPIECTVSAF